MLRNLINRLDLGDAAIEFLFFTIFASLALAVIKCFGWVGFAVFAFGAFMCCVFWIIEVIDEVTDR